MNDTHQNIQDKLSEYLDNELDASERAQVDQHLKTCRECSTALLQLRAIVEQAKRLGGQLPATDLWSGVMSRIQPQTSSIVSLERPQRRRFSFTLPQLAAAGIALMVLSGGLVHYARSGAPLTPVSGIPSESSKATDKGITPVVLADPRYEDAVQDLERTLAEGRGRLDPDTVRVLEQNLATIDKAIAQSREALEADPNNVFLNNHLISARQRKLALLRRATALTTGS